MSPLRRWYEKVQERERLVPQLKASLALLESDHFLTRQLPKTVNKADLHAKLEKDLHKLESTKPPNIVSLMRQRHLGKSIKFI